MGTSNERQWYDIAFYMSSISYILKFKAHCAELSLGGWSPDRAQMALQDALNIQQAQGTKWTLMGVTGLGMEMAAAYALSCDRLI